MNPGDSDITSDNQAIAQPLGDAENDTRALRAADGNRMSRAAINIATQATELLELRPPSELKSRIDKWVWQRDDLIKTNKRVVERTKELDEFLSIAEDVTQALQTLSESLFEKVLRMLEQNLTIAVQEVLEQPIEFKTETSFKHGAANVRFHVERDGNKEDIQRGQGGSVQNVLSVGLRVFALAGLSDTDHRRFLVLDEQDCWLRPELVPRLVNIVHKAALELDFQVIMISHHRLGLFEKYADKIYRLDPTNDGLKLECVDPHGHSVDSHLDDDVVHALETIEKTESTDNEK